MKYTINLTKYEQRHIIQNEECYLDSCETIIKIMDKLKKKVKKGS